MRSHYACSIQESLQASPRSLSKRFVCTYTKQLYAAPLCAFTTHENFLSRLWSFAMHTINIIRYECLIWRRMPTMGSASIPTNCVTPKNKKRQSASVPLPTQNHFQMRAEFPFWDLTKKKKKKIKHSFHSVHIFQCSPTKKRLLGCPRSISFLNSEFAGLN